MKGLEALKEIKSRLDVTLYHQYKEAFANIETELKLLNLLKEKKVDLSFIDNLIYKVTDVWKFELENATMEMTARYNMKNNIHLTQEELQLIVDWLKEE